MMRRVLKWTVPVDDAAHLIGGGPILLVACQSRPDQVQVWTESTFERTTVARAFGTGQPVPAEWTHAGSTVTADGVLVWHVYVMPLEVWEKRGGRVGVEHVVIPPQRGPLS